ncbi:YegP family protein [Pantoea agglomerans]
MSSTLSTSTQQYYFVLKATNGEVIATSEMYNSKQGAENGIRSVQSNGSTTDIRDET